MQISYDQMLSLAGTFGFEVVEEPISGDCTGLYLSPYRMIVVDHSLPEYAKRCVLCHELIHAEHDDSGCGSKAGEIAEARARRETALHLIDPIEYASAEKIYEGDSFKIANELDVTTQVVEDYKSWLSSHPPLLQAMVD